MENSVSSISEVAAVGKSSMLRGCCYDLNDLQFFISFVMCSTFEGHRLSGLEELIL
jgi:hypothetical protein